MTEDIEERFRAACSAYLLMAEQLDRAQGDAEAAEVGYQRARVAADRARDELLQVVRERDAAAQLDARRETVQPGPLAAAARDRWIDAVLASGGAVSSEVMAPEDTDWWAKHGGMCPECGVSWREPSPDCSHRVVNWHPRH